MTLLVGLGILGSLGLPVQNAVSPSARFATCATAFMLYAHERGLPPG
jgi:hypothetical protein